MNKSDSKPVYFEQKVDKIFELVTEIHNALFDDESIMSVEDIARYWGVSKRSLYGAKRYLLPNFGKSENGERNTYKKGEFYKWASIGREELRRMYKEEGIAK